MWTGSRHSDSAVLLKYMLLILIAAYVRYATFCRMLGRNKTRAGCCSLSNSNTPPCNSLLTWLLAQCSTVIGLDEKERWRGLRLVLWHTHQVLDHRCCEYTLLYSRRRCRLATHDSCEMSVPCSWLRSLSTACTACCHQS